MNKSELLVALAGMPDRDPRLEQMAAIVSGKVKTDKPASFRLFKPGEVCAEVSISRPTLWRLEQEGAIKSIELRKGSKRYPESEVRRLIEGRK